jgi:hypothetical protein
MRMAVSDALGETDEQMAKRKRSKREVISVGTIRNSEGVAIGDHAQAVVIKGDVVYGDKDENGDAADTERTEKVAMSSQPATVPYTASNSKFGYVV